ncbi:MAG: deoxyribonuclease V [Candidatus Altiarchaeales archaeon]|nr:MAG: deoxyribonuclease V [Candidatus Altiarchaeales archaeon]
MAIKLEKLAEVQEMLRKKVVLADTLPNEIKYVAGVDQSFPNEKEVISAIVLLRFPELSLKAKSFSRVKVNFPYIPGFLAFRELPAILKAWKNLSKKPDVLLVDGHGIAHPRGLGIASHLGVLIKRPTIGVAKRLLVGKYKAVREEMLASEIIYQGKLVGYALKSKPNCKEIFISPGNMISAERALEITKKCIAKHKLPEPLRLAHRLSKELKEE